VSHPKFPDGHSIAFRKILSSRLNFIQENYHGSTLLSILQADRASR
jgi:hypothetical protein